MMTDEQLVQSYGEGDEHALELLIQRYANHIYNFVRQYIRDGREAEDVAQESFMKAWKHLKKFDPEKKFKVWLFQIARNTAIDHLRKKKEIPFSDRESEDGEFANTLVDEGPTMDELAHRKDVQMQIKKLLGQLPAQYAAVLILYYQDGLNFREIAEIDGTSVNTVKSRHKRALALLRDKLSKEYGG